MNSNKTVRKIIFLVFSLTLTGVLQAQRVRKISGEITGTDKKPLDGIVVSLLRAKDTLLIKAIITDSLGRFEFVNLQPDTFLITITNMAYQKYTSDQIFINDQQPELLLPIIELSRSEAKLLSEVTVVSKLPFVERKIDRTVINPDALLSNAGSNALEVLEKSPGIQVDMNGVISLKGKQGVVVYIDDKPTYLSATDLANYLRSLPSGSIGLIEIMTNPPAKYDAAGNAGVINIKLKKNKAKGLNGGVNISYGQGVYARSNNSFNVNYRVNKINFFTNLSYNINNSYQDLYIKRAYFNENGSLASRFNQNSYIKREPIGATLKLGMDYYITKKATMGIVFAGFRNVNKQTTTNLAQLYDSNEMLQNNVTAFSPSKRVFKNGSININYNYKFNETGKELLLNADYLEYDSKMQQSLLNSIYLPGGGFVSKSNLISDLPATIDIKTFKADYIHPLKKGMRLEAGLKTSFINTDNVANFFDEANGVTTINYDFSNNFKYKENINAIYLNYSLEHKQFSFQTGIRFENTCIEGIQSGNSVRNDSLFTRNYNSLFPTLYVNYKLDTLSKHQLSFSYGRRIDRPNYQDLNPFTYPLDRFTLYAGNPFLKPTFSNNFEFSHIYKNILTTTLQFSYTKDVISETIEQNTNTFYSRPGNIGQQVSYGISVNASFKLLKWWNIQLYSELIRNEFKAKLYNQNLNNSGNYWYVGPTNLFQINKKWSAELSGSYQTRIVYGQFILIPVWTMRAGVSKKILKEKGTLKLNVNDLFYTNQPGGDIKSLANSTASWLSYLDSRVVSISFSYRFSKGKGLAARASGGSDSEKNRVK